MALANASRQLMSGSVMMLRHSVISPAYCLLKKVQYYAAAGLKREPYKLSFYLILSMDDIR